MRTFIVMVFMLTFCVVSLAQTTWNVPGDFSSIQDAFNDASVVEGDTILVGPGTYYENISFLGKDVTLKSTAGPAATVIDGGRVYSVVQFTKDNGTESILDGFTITNGLNWDVYADYSGGGVLCGKYSAAVLINNIITQNTAVQKGGGISALRNSRVTIMGNTISENSAEQGGGIFGDSYYCSLTIEDNIIMNNTVTIYGGGIRLGRYAKGIITNNLIMGNEAVDNGGGISAIDGRMIVANNAIVNNLVTNPAGVGGGVYTHQHNNSLFANNTITGNQASDGGGFHNYQHPPIIINSIIWGNSGNQISYTDPPLITYSNIEGGWAGTGNIDADPLWVSGPEGDYYLSQISSGQGADSPCVDTGSNLTFNVALNTSWTRIDEAVDSGMADMGVHYGPYTPYSLTTDSYEVSHSLGGSIQLTVDPGPFPPAWQYLILGSISGTSPGTMLPGNVTIPLNWDLFTALTIDLTNTTIFSKFMNTLPQNARATAYFNLPPNSGAAGLTMYFAYGLGLPWSFASNPVKITIVP